MVLLEGGSQVDNIFFNSLRDLHPSRCFHFLASCPLVSISMSIAPRQHRRWQARWSIAILLAVPNFHTAVTRNTDETNSPSGSNNTEKFSRIFPPLRSVSATAVFGFSSTLLLSNICLQQYLRLCRNVLSAVHCFHITPVALLRPGEVLWT
jgi:hypothetical protein